MVGVHIPLLQTQSFEVGKARLPSGQKSRVQVATASREGTGGGTLLSSH